MSAPRKKILFVAEAVTLAHISRPVVLAGGLDPSRYDVVLATAPRFESLWRNLPVRVRPIDSIPVDQFLDALAKGRPLYDAATLRRYVAEDLEVIREVGPDVIVGDCRMSLSVSARVAGVPYLAITNAYWSPYHRQGFPVPELPIVQWVGLPLARVGFAVARPLAFALHAEPLNRVRREHGLPSLGHDLRRAYTDADQTLYADVPELVPTTDLPASHHYIGPVLWSPDVALPSWWDEVDTGRPVVYVAMGSSGAGALLWTTLDALADLPVTVIAATLGQTPPRPVPSNARTAVYLPGREASARAALVVCNGGSPSTHQALASGVPVVGVAGNMDQHMNMTGIVKAGAGESIRSDRASARSVRAAAVRVLERPGYREGAGAVARAFEGYDAAARFGAAVGGAAGRPPLRG